MISNYVARPVVPDDTCPGLFHLEEAPRLQGISARYLENAEEDFVKFANYAHPYWAILREVSARGLLSDEATVIDLASGFGNTVIPLLRDFKKSRVIASDLSEQTLRILIREASQKGLGDRVSCFVCDAQENLW